MSNDIYNINLSILQAHPYFDEKKFTKFFPNLVKEIYTNTAFLNNYNPTFSERRYCYENKVTELVKCKICGEKINYIKSYGYKQTCCKNCFYEYMRTEAVKKSKKTKLIKHGDENFNNIEKQKSHRTKEWEILRGYKISNTKRQKSDDEKQKHIEKIKNTKLKRYGDENFNNPVKMFQTKSNNISNGLKYKHTIPNTLYIIYSKELNLIKIGVTSNITRRLNEIKKDFKITDIEKLNIIKYQNTVKLLETENRLHKLFENYNIKLKEGGGKTEWYDIIIKKYLIISKFIQGI